MKTRALLDSFWIKHLNNTINLPYQTIQQTPKTHCHTAYLIAIYDFVDTPCLETPSCMLPSSASFSPHLMAQQRPMDLILGTMMCNGLQITGRWPPATALLQYLDYFLLCCFLWNGCCQFYWWISIYTASLVAISRIDGRATALSRDLIRSVGAMGTSIATHPFRINKIESW